MGNKSNRMKRRSTSKRGKKNHMISSKLGIVTRSQSQSMTMVKTPETHVVKALNAIIAGKPKNRLRKKMISIGEIEIPMRKLSCQEYYSLLGFTNNVNRENGIIICGIEGLDP